MYMMMFVLDNPDKLDDVLASWYKAGVGGATITESSGSYRRRKAQPIGARYLFGAPTVSQGVGRGNITLFAIVPDEATVRRCIEATEGVTGDLSEPNTGIFSAWELDIVKGLHQSDTTSDEQ